MSGRDITVTVDGFANAVQSILDEFGGNATEALTDAVKEQAKETQKEIKANSPVRTGKYKKGWKVKYEATRLGMKATIYNENAGMPHLLEHGHVVRNGKRIGAGKKHFVDPSPKGGHIAPAEAKVENGLIEKLKDRLEGGA